MASGPNPQQLLRWLPKHSLPMCIDLIPLQNISAVLPTAYCQSLTPRLQGASSAPDSYGSCRDSLRTPVFHAQHDSSQGSQVSRFQRLQRLQRLQLFRPTLASILIALSAQICFLSIPTCRVRALDADVLRYSLLYFLPNGHFPISISSK